MIQANPTFDAWGALRTAFELAEKLAQVLGERLKNTQPLPTEAVADAAEAAFTATAAVAGNSREFRRLEYLRLAKETARTRARQKNEHLKISRRWVATLEEKLARARDDLAPKSKGGLTEETLRLIEEQAKLL